MSLYGVFITSKWNEDKCVTSALTKTIIEYWHFKSVIARSAAINCVELGEDLSIQQYSGRPKLQFNFRPTVCCHKTVDGIEEITWLCRLNLSIGNVSIFNILDDCLTGCMWERHSLAVCQLMWVVRCASCHVQSPKKLIYRPTLKPWQKYRANEIQARLLEKPWPRRCEWMRVQPRLSYCCCCCCCQRW